MNERTHPQDDGTRKPVLPTLCAAVAVAIGLTVLIGWALDIAAMKSLIPGLITMKPNAALGFILAGGALGANGRGRLGARVATWLAASAATLGALTLIEYGSGVDLRIDQLLAREPVGSVGSLRPGRMHPTTALDFTLIGVAILLLVDNRRHTPAQALALIASLVAGSALIGYAYGVRRFIHAAAYNQMALHTTIGMLALSFGVLMSRPGRGLMAAITGDGAGGLMARRLLPVAVLLPFTLDGLAILSNRAQIFDERFATAVRVIATIAILVGCIGWSAHVLQRVERERQRSEQAFRILADAMPQIVWTSPPDGRVDYCNRRAIEYTGMEPGSDGEWRGYRATHPDDLRRCLLNWSRAVRSGEGFEIEYRYRRASDGSYRWHLGRAEPMRDARGAVVRWFGTSTDIHEQKRAGEQRYRSLVEATTAMVWNTPASGEFEYEQPGWSEFTGQDFGQLKGRGWLDAIHPDDRPETARLWSEAVAGRSLFQIEHRLRRHDGEYRHMMGRAVPIFSEDGRVCEWVGVHTDVDVQKRAEVALREAKEAAEAATRAKGEFLANMSHEIRTPMNGILGMTELTLGTDLTDRQREYLGLVKSSGDALMTVINDILDFSKIEAGKLTLDPIPFAVRDMVTDTLRSLAIRAHGKGLELACRIAPEVPEWLVGDPGRLRQVLVNLVGNAIKFTEKGEVFVSVGAGEGQVVRFAVADTGIGIPASKRDAIFAPFEQADGSTTRKYGGTGLGLTISSRLVELMGGRIWVEDHPGGGSVFCFTARLPVDDESRPVPRSADPWRMTGLRVLIVDDNRTNRLVLEELLGQWGCLASSAVGGPEALEAMARAVSRGEPYEVVLLDWMMPGMDGPELAERVHSDPGFLGVKMLMLTSAGSDESDGFQELGIGGCLSKPIRHSELFNSLARLIGPSADGPPTGVPAGDLIPEEPAGRRLRILLAEDHPINQKVATRMLEDQGHRVTVVGDGRSAVEVSGSSRFDVILMDVQMPEMDGFEAVHAIRSRERGSGAHLPIVALTAHAMTGDRERCLGSGFDDYLTKPIQAASLRAALGRIEGSGQDHGTVGNGEPDVGVAFDRRAALETLGGDERLLDEVLGLFLDDCPRLMAEIRAAIEAGDAPTIGRLAHTVSGVSSNFAAPEVVGAARRLEAMGKSAAMAGAEGAGVELGDALDRFRQAVAASQGGAARGPIRAS